MREIDHLIRAFEEAKQKQMKTALATVVHVEGSSYRRAGARMLIREDGELTGAISGGCLEGDALRKAMLAISQQQNKLVSYDTSDEEDAAIGMQLGCEGVIQVLFEPINADDPDNPIELLKKVSSQRQEYVLVTLFSLENKRSIQAGTTLLLKENGNLTGEIMYVQLEKEIIKDARKALKEKKSIFRRYTRQNNSVTVFFEFLNPPISLVIVGAGNDAVPVMQIADSIGWHVRIVDGRNTLAKPERFVSACQVVVSNPQNVLDEIPVDAYTAFVLMTHNYNYDFAMVKGLLQKDIPYIGMLGPKTRLDKIFNQLENEGITISNHQMKKFYGPSGLEIGAETPEEIALSIIAEIKAVFSQKTGSSLRNKKEVIHSRKETAIKTKEVF